MEPQRRLNLIDSRSSHFLIERLFVRCATSRLSQLVLLLSCLLLATNTSRSADRDLPVLEEPGVVADEILPDADKMAFAHSFERAAKDGDTQTLNSLIDWENILALITAGPDSATLNRAREGFSIGFMAGQNKGTVPSLVGQIVQVVEQGGSFKFIRFGEFENQPAALFRLKLPNQGGANYHWYFLKRSKDGLVRAQDIYIYLTAERISETVRRVWLPLASEVSKNVLEKWLKPVDPLITAIGSLNKMQGFIQDGQFEQALDVYRKLPENVQTTKVMLLFQLRAAMNTTEEDYAKAIEDYRKAFPRDAALDFLLIDGYSLKEDYEKALECINRTNESLGGDTWMVCLRGNAFAKMGRFEEAREAVEEAIENEPDLEDAYWTAISISILGKNDDDTVRYLTCIEELFGKTLGDLTEVPFYADFVKTPQFENWIEARK